jgi:hypothetical protein
LLLLRTMRPGDRKFQPQWQIVVGGKNKTTPRPPPRYRLGVSMTRIRCWPKVEALGQEH